MLQNQGRGYLNRLEGDKGQGLKKCGPEGEDRVQRPKGKIQCWRPGDRSLRTRNRGQGLKDNLEHGGRSLDSESSGRNEI